MLPVPNFAFLQAAVSFDISAPNYKKFGIAIPPGRVEQLATQWGIDIGAVVFTWRVRSQFCLYIRRGSLRFACSGIQAKASRR